MRKKSRGQSCWGTCQHTLARRISSGTRGHAMRNIEWLCSSENGHERDIERNELHNGGFGECPQASGCRTGKQYSSCLDIRPFIPFERSCTATPRYVRVPLTRNVVTYFGNPPSNSHAAGLPTTNDGGYNLNADSRQQFTSSYDGFAFKWQACWRSRDMGFARAASPPATTPR